MPDGARSDDPRVQRQLDRLSYISPAGDRLGLERIRRLLERLGDPQDRLPPVLHVAGTNGKGSTCAVLRAAVEAAGGRAHVFTSPHLVRFNERIRIAGRLIDDAALADGLERVLDVGADLEPSFFEVATAVALTAFAETPADATILEVGLGGRLDATNVVARPVACGIAALGLDHQAFLGDRIEAIAAEKAGIAKPGVPLVTLAYPPAVAEAIEAAAGVSRIAQDRDWQVAADGDGLRYADVKGALRLAMPELAGAHQIDNAGLAVAMLRHAEGLALPDAAVAAAAGRAVWPARLQRLTQGRLVERLPRGAELWVDGAHNPQAAEAMARHFAGRRVHLVLGLLETKAVKEVVRSYAPMAARLTAVPIAGHGHHPPGRIAELARMAGIREVRVVERLVDTVEIVAPEEMVLIAGSLHLAGEALAANGTPPN